VADRNDIRWTESQRLAIETRGRNLLVAASAGTGKTAVLVERCIQLATNPEEPIDIDRMLVVTFTDAAAAEMRNRISEAFRKRIVADPGNTRLRRQLILLDRASISTLHAYAFRTLQEQFFRLGLDPNLNVMDPEEANLLRLETLDEVFETLYTDEGEAGERFRRLVGRYGRNGDDAPVRVVALELSDFMRSLPWPEQWRDNVLESYPAPGSSRQFDEMPHWYQPFVEALGEELGRLAVDAREAARGAFTTLALPPPYFGHFLTVAEMLESLSERLAADGYDAMQQAVQNWEYPRLVTIKGIDETLREEVKRRNDAIRNDFKKQIQDTWCAFTGERWLATLQSTRGDVESLFEVVSRFDEAFQRAKRERGEVDFHDLERLCFDLLLEREASSEGRLAPSVVAREIRDRYEAVLVDEYQDISPLQDAIIQLSSRQDDDAHRSPNLFMVGDVKQSIYRFRLAEPRIFLERFRTYREEEKSGQSQRIDLNENHRSRPKLLSTLNSIFRLIMIPAVGRIAYDASAELRGGFDFPPPDSNLPPPTTGVPIEVHVFDRSGEAVPAAESEETSEAVEAPAELEQIEVEALWVAERIKKMTDSKEFSIWDRHEKRYRPVAYRDIAVLLQTAIYKADVFVRVMRSQGVPCYTDVGSGYLEATEICDMLSLLELLDNPYQEIPLAAVLRSPLVALTEDDLARIRILRREDDFFSAAVAYGREGPEEPLRKRLAAFLERLERWRGLARRGPLARTLWTIYDETGYLDYVTAMDDGAQRRANLIGLYDRARQFDEFTRRGLGRFLEFIRRLQETEGDLGSPSAISEAENVVRVMSIHKSKGLEFSVVFVPDIGKRFNFENAQGDLVTDRDLGVALREVDAARAVKYPTAAHLLVARRAQREMLAEQMRLLYVAMTRAREKLILCGSVELDAAREKWLSAGRGGGSAGDTLDTATVASAKCFSDWLGPALARLGCLDEMVEQASSLSSQMGKGSGASGEAGFVVHFHRADEWAGRQLSRRDRGPDEKALRTIAAMGPVAAPPHDREAVARIMERLAWHYPCRRLTEIRGKFSVTELKRRFETGRESDEATWEYFLPAAARRPVFITAAEEKATRLTAAEIGTAVHSILRHLDLELPADDETVRRQIEQMVARGVLSEAEAGAVDPALIVRFLNSPLGVAMRQQPSRVQREMPFSLAVRVDEIERLSTDRTFVSGASCPTAESAPPSQEEWVHVQGIIDCLIERPEGFALLDFKTDRIEAAQAATRADYYRTQISLYARAVETIFKRSVIQRTLYFLHPSVAVDLKPGT
jgi:ATP-dependent helicase/nuclease subunit A